MELSKHTQTYTCNVRLMHVCIYACMHMIYQEVLPNGTKTRMLKTILVCVWWKAINGGTSHIDPSEAVMLVISFEVTGHLVCEISTHISLI